MLVMVGFAAGHRAIVYAGRREAARPVTFPRFAGSGGNPDPRMKFLIALLLWAIVLLLCWPIALLLLVLWPILWLLSIPFRMVGTLVEALLALVKAVLFLPSRILGGGDRQT